MCPVQPVEKHGISSLINKASSEPQCRRASIKGQARMDDLILLLHHILRASLTGRKEASYLPGVDNRVNLRREPGR